MKNDKDSSIKPGTLVSYFDNGYRVGYLEKVKGKSASIRPLMAYKKSHKRREILVELGSISPV